MLFNWVDYCAKYENELETWANDNDTRRFATFDGTIKEIHEYYMGVSDDYDGHDYELNNTYFCKVVLDGDVITAILFMVRNDKCPHNTVHINPVIVNPKHRNKGYCTKIIGELADNISEIIGYDTNAITADFDLENKASIRAFEKVGFSIAGTNETGDFTYWAYPASKVENYRKYCADSMGDKFIAASTL